MERSLNHRVAGRLLVLRQNNRPPTDDDWDAFCKEMTRLRPRLKEMRAMVFTDGGGPTTEQRKKLATAMGGGEIQTAVITDKGIVRFIVSTIGLFNKTIRTFNTQEAGAAFTWLGLTVEDEATVKEMVRELEKTVGGLRPVAQPKAS